MTENEKQAVADSLRLMRVFSTISSQAMRQEIIQFAESRVNSQKLIKVDQDNLPPKKKARLRLSRSFKIPAALFERSRNFLSKKFRDKSPRAN